MNASKMSKASITAAIETLQEVQKGCGPKAREWHEASAVLRLLYAEMAKREELLAVQP